MFYVEVTDLPEGPRNRGLHFRLGPFVRECEAEAIAKKARATGNGTVACVIEGDMPTRSTRGVAR